MVATAEVTTTTLKIPYATSVCLVSSFGWADWAGPMNDPSEKAAVLRTEDKRTEDKRTEELLSCVRRTLAFGGGSFIGPTYVGHSSGKICVCPVSAERRPASKISCASRLAWGEQKPSTSDFVSRQCSRYSGPLR